VVGRLIHHSKYCTETEQPVREIAPEMVDKSGSDSVLVEIELFVRDEAQYASRPDPEDCRALPILSMGCKAGYCLLRDSSGSTYGL
jgi:hypothetical protein